MRRAPRTARALARAERGFTLIELMVAVALSGLLISLIFGIQLRMTTAFRGQAQVAAIAEMAAAARELIAAEARQAGRGMPPNGLAVPAAVAPAGRVWAVQVDNGTDADVLVLRRADTDPVRGTILNSTVTVTSAAGIVAGDLLMLVNNDPGNPDGCMARANSVVGQLIDFDIANGGAPINQVGMPHCANLAVSATVWVSKLLVTQFQLSAGDPANGILQVYFPKTSLGPASDLGIGFSNLQFAIRRFEAGDLVDADGDGDPIRDWYSGNNQEDPITLGNLTGRPIAIGVTVEGRNLTPIRQVFAEATPPLTVMADTDNNPVGDWGHACSGNPQFDPCGVDLLALPILTRPPRYRGDFIYRATSTVVVLRNTNGTDL